jgi:transposase
MAGGAAMAIRLTGADRAELERAAAREPRVRHWRRYRAVLLLSEGTRTEEVAAVLGCGASSVYAWAAAWRRHGLAGLVEAPRPQRPPRLAGAGEVLLAEVLSSDPQAHGRHATGWTVPQLRSELAERGYALSERTIRRALHRAGWRWKRPKYVLGRPDPQYAAKKARSRSG